MVIWIPGHPRPEPRTKSSVFRAKTTGQVTSRVYTPSTANSWKECVHIAVRPYLRPEMIESGVMVSVAVFLPRPKYLEHKKTPAHPLPVTGRNTGDRDNYDKAILDALTDVGLWKDDCQVFCGGLSKWYVAKGGRPGALVVVEPMDESAWFSCVDRAVVEARALGAGLGSPA